ncbi:MAG: DUF2975 domain-containing protein [Clostridia bacterium]|nr:DUF2975 domain-containing protein [Clostridia bacterium]
MKEQAIEKINKMGKAGRIISTVFLVLIGIGAVACLISFFAMNAIPKGFITVTGDGIGEVKVDLTKIDYTLTTEEIEQIKAGNSSFNSFEQNDLKFVEVTENSLLLQSESGKIGFDISNVKFTVFVAFLVVVTAFITMLTMQRLCKAFEICASPFEENVIKKMQNLAYSLLPWVFALSIAEGSLGNPFNPKFSLGIDLGMIFVVLIVFALVYVFKYGAMLQQESDETL